jgi:hypothetical protein
MFFNIVWFCVFSLFAFWVWDDIGNIPLSELTLKMIFNNAFAAFLFWFGIRTFWDD